MTARRVSPREQMGVAALAVAVLFFAYGRFVLNPAKEKIAAHQSAVKKAEKQMLDLKRVDPVEEKQKKRMQMTRSEIENLEGEIGLIENQIPPLKETQRLIQELTKAIPVERLLSFRQKVVPEEPYYRIYYEILVRCTYPEALEIIWKIESLSSFLVMEEMAMEEPKGSRAEESELHGVPIKIVVSCILKESGEAAQFLQPAAEGKKAEPAFQAVKRDILANISSPARKQAKRKIGLKLEGITYAGENSVVIIDGNVYRKNTEVDGFLIKEVLQNAVIVADDIGEYRLDISGGEAVRVDTNETS